MWSRFKELGHNRHMCSGICVMDPTVPVSGAVSVVS